MNYSPFSGFSNTFSNLYNNPMLQRIPSMRTTTTTPMGGMSTSSSFGLSGLSPSMAAAAQKQEFGRLQGVQGLQTGMIQQQMLGAQARSQTMDVEEAERRRGIERAIERGPNLAIQMNPSFGYGGMQDPYQTAASTDYGKQLLQQRRLRELELEKAEFEGQAYRGGGFSAWATPAFPSMR
jgi:hypothetical protein